jgi:hypothetical protein
MRRRVDRAKAGMRPGGTRVLLASLLLALSASGCIDLDTALDSLTVQLEDMARHDTPAPRREPVREQVPAPRVARVRGTLVAGLAVSRADIPPPKETQAAFEGTARLAAAGQVPVKAVRLAVVGAPRREVRTARGTGTMLGIARGRAIRSTEPSSFKPLFPESTPLLARRVLPDAPLSRQGPGPSLMLEAAKPPPPLLAQLEVASSERPWGGPHPALPGSALGRRGPVLADGPDGPLVGGALVVRGERGRQSGGLRPEHLHASARRGRVARVPATGPGWALAGRRLEWDAGRHRGRVRGGLERRAREHPRDHRVPPAPWPGAPRDVGRGGVGHGPGHPLAYRERGRDGPLAVDISVRQED